MALRKRRNRQPPCRPLAVPVARKARAICRRSRNPEAKRRRRRRAMASYQRCPELPSGVAPDTRLYLRPVAKPARDLLAESEPLAGGPLGFDAVEAILRPPTGTSTVALTSLAQLRRWAKDEGSARRDEVTRWLRQMAPRPENILDLSAERPLLMGVLNITPDSFSDGGDFLAPDVALKQANALVIAGADILDLGAESTRPGAEATAAKEQLHRLLPVLVATGGAR